MVRWRWLIGLWGVALLIGSAAAAPRQQETPTATLTAPSGLFTLPAPTFETPTLPAAPAVWLSPTPDETGAIRVVVQPGESLWIIAARAGLSLPELLALNDLTEADIINPGDVLLIGFATPVAPVSPEEGTPTATPPPPTLRPTDVTPQASICLTAFDDLNGDGVFDAGEPLRAGVAFTIYNTQAVVANYITDGVSEPKCLSGLLPGEYRVTRSIAPGESLTTAGDWALSLTAGSELRQAFGSTNGAPTTPRATAAAPTAVAQANATETVPAPGPATGGNRATGLRVAGVIALFLGGLILLGAVLLLFLRRSRRGPTPDAPADGERHFRKLDDL